MSRAVRGLDLRPLTLLQPRRGYTPDFLSPPPDSPVGSPGSPGSPASLVSPGSFASFASFADELARIAATPPPRARAEIARSLAETPGAEHTATGRLLLEGEPAEVVALLAGLVAAAWEALVEPYWPRTRALLEADIAFQARRLAGGGLDRLFAELHPSVRWHDSVLTREHGGADHRDLEGEGLVLMPSAFKWDQVVIVLDPPWQPTLIYPARGIGNLWQADAGADAHAAALARLVGRTRARLLAGLAEPAATAWLAHRYGLAPATVSEHLSVLRDTGLVTATRHRHEVRYARTELGDMLARSGG